MAMEAKDIFEALSRNVREMFGDRGLGLYIPAYQRPYGWDKDKVSKLLDDIFHGYKLLLGSEESFTFLGTVITIHDTNFKTVQPIVKPDVPAKVLTIIDGQQRLTTLLLICVALHNHLQLARKKFLKSKKAETLSDSEKWLVGQTANMLDHLASTFHEKQSYGDAPLYPRMIRSFDDQWSKNKQYAKYASPIAYFLNNYLSIFEVNESSNIVEYKPVKQDAQIEGEQALVDRYVQISKLLKSFKDEDVEDDLPTLKDISRNSKFQNALLNHEFLPEVQNAILKDETSTEFNMLLQLVLVASYVLNRVAVTVVRGRDEDYAFTIFESLNTTGEPLTAFETFKPKVVSAEGIERYEDSNSRKCLDIVSKYLSKYRVGEELQSATRELLISFAAAETGYKLSKRLAEQRRYLTEEFKRYENDAAKRLQFVQHLEETAQFRVSAWEVKDEIEPSLPLFDTTTDSVKLCLAFLSGLKHSITIAPLVRFYSTAIHASPSDKVGKCRDFEDAIKAITAFSVLWRASRRGTANVDNEYREIMSGLNSLTNLPPLARSLKKEEEDKAGVVSPKVDLSTLKVELRARLRNAEHGNIVDRATFIIEGSKVPAYKNNTHVARFILLSAYHNAVADNNKSSIGLMCKGKAASCPCLTYDGIKDDKHLSLEHIAPQKQSVGWNDSIYAAEDSELIHCIGNLVLVQQDANTSLADRPWKEKQIIYRALGASTQDEAKKILREASDSGYTFAESTENLVSLSKHMPHLIAIGQKKGEWDANFIKKRSENILGMAWDELYSWLN